MVINKYCSYIGKNMTIINNAGIIFLVHILLS